MLKLFIAGLVASTLLTSCIHRKKIFEGNSFFRITSTPPPLGGGGATHTLEQHTVTQSFNTVVTDKDDYLLIGTPPAGSYTTVSIPITAPVGWRASIINKYYFDEDDLAPSHRRSFWYFDSKPVLQTLTIPLKIRPKLTEPAFKDSFATTAETGINIALAGGWKFNFNQYQQSKNIFGQRTQRLSISLGLLLGAGAVDLKKSNTRNPVIEFERKAPVVTTGLFFLLGFNQLNVGYSFGWDNAKGKGGPEWLYQNRKWHGITFGLDLIK